MASMLEDDDMVLLIVGDDMPVINYQKAKNPSPPESIHQDPLDNEENTAVDEILQTVARHGEYISIKQDKEDQTEFSDKDLAVQLVKQFNEEEEEDESDPEDPGYLPDEHGFRLKLHRKPTYALVETQRKSFIQELRTENPEMEQDPELLVEHLASVMRNVRPPTPPPNYCKVVHDEDNLLKYVCTICDAKSAAPGIATRHYQQKHGKRYLICFACGADFRVKANLYKHEKRCIAPDASVAVQARERCGRKERSSFVSNNILKNDPSPSSPPPASNNTKRFYCTKCPESFVTRYNLIAHENSHEGVRPYRCDACPATYTCDTHLRRHKQIHSDTQYICDHCGRICKLKSILRAHLDTHRPIRKFGCDHCERRFAQKSALVHHRNTNHLNLPPVFGCPVCPKRFARMSHVKDHMKKHGMTIITRRMFHKVLPTMTETQIKDATVILDSETHKIKSNGK